MPRIPDDFLDSVCYAYTSRECAEAGKDFGGTAFVVGIPSESTKDWFLYAVTNYHVAVAKGASVLRFNTISGDQHIIEYDPSEWFFLPSRNRDIAIVPLSLQPKQVKFRFIPTTLFATLELVRCRQIGPGDDVFMVGRFIDHDGRLTNKPAARFGNISVMPVGVKSNTLGVELESYIIDMHSRSGYSGSPVFVYRTPGYDLSMFANQAMSLAPPELFLLGIHTGQFPEPWEIKHDSKIEDEVQTTHKSLSIEGHYVSGISGMSFVQPVWAIQKTLDMPQLKKMRESG